MPARFFTQSAIVLFERAPDIATLEAALAEFEITKRLDVGQEQTWMGGYPGVVVAMRPEVNGYLLVDVVDKPWPDHMGSSTEEPDLLGAWSMGWFGPLVFPGSLDRAMTNSRVVGDDVGDLAADHGAFARMMISYVLGADDPVLTPPDHDPAEELRFLTRLAKAVLGIDGAIAYFNPNGETLFTAAGLSDVLACYEENEALPMEIWSNVRLLRPDDAPGWFVMDTVGMEQLGQQDHEICIPESGFDGRAGAVFLRTATDYLLERGPVIEDGNTMSHPDGDAVFRAEFFDESLWLPPRPVIRWRPAEGPLPPKALGFEPPKRGFLSRLRGK